MTVEYSCDQCGVANRAVEVPDRPDPQEDVRSYMDKVVRRVSADHRTVSPTCRARTLSKMKIPHSHPGGWIGKPS